MLLAQVVLISACASVTTPKVHTSSEPGHDFSTYKTFTWATNPPMIAESEYNIPAIAEKELTDAFKDSLTNKGYTFTDNESDADFAVSFTVGARDKIKVDSYPVRYYENYQSWTWGQGYYYPVTRERSINTGFTDDKLSVYQSGSLAVDIYDVKKKRPVWHANGNKRLSKRDFATPGKGSFAAASTLLASFPIRQ